jgi:hypothetical protein
MQSLRRTLSGNDVALLKIAAIQPISRLPALHQPAAEKLRDEGLLRRQGDVWFPTADGLALSKRATL